jgi:hypothetical protein
LELLEGVPLCPFGMIPAGVDMRWCVAFEKEKAYDDQKAQTVKLFFRTFGPKKTTGAFLRQDSKM